MQFKKTGKGSCEPTDCIIIHKNWPAAWCLSWCALLPSGTPKLERDRSNQGMIEGIRTAHPRCPPVLNFCDDRSGNGCDKTQTREFPRFSSWTIKFWRPIATEKTSTGRQQWISTMHVIYPAFTVPRLSCFPSTSHCWGIQENPLTLETSSLTNLVQWAFRVIKHCEYLGSWICKAPKSRIRDDLESWTCETPKSRIYEDLESLTWEALKSRTWEDLEPESVKFGNLLRVKFRSYGSEVMVREGFHE
jgi:hypothetical protein